MPLTVISSDFFLPLGSVKLGRLVKSVEFPTLNYHDPPYSQAPEGTPHIQDQYKCISHGESSISFGSKLTSLMSSGFSKRAKAEVRIETDMVKTYKLDNSEAWFSEATNFDETRRWIESAIGGDGVFLVVGFHTVTDARVVHESIKGHQLGGEFTIPVGLSLTTVGVVAPLGNIVNPSANGHQTVLNGVKTQFIAPGEQICGVQYLKASYRWLYSRKVDNLILAKAPRWTATESWRNAIINEVEDEPDILEVEIEEFEQLEGDWDQEVSEDGEVLLIRSVEESDEF